MTEASSKRKRVWLSWSSGKDCAFTLHTLRTEYSDQYDVTGLLTTFNQTANRVAMHAVRSQLLKMQAEAAGLPVYEVMLPSPCTNEEYNTRMTAAVAAAKAAGVDAIAFGDLFLEDVRAYREMNMRNSGMGTIFPLWLADSSSSSSSSRTTAQLAQQMIAAGVRAVLTCVDPKRLPKEFAGRYWDKQLLQELPEGVDPCGENGEFHTFVFDGPMFKHPLDIRVGQTVERDGFCFCDVVPPGMSMEAAAAEVAAAEAAAAAAAKAAAAAAAAAGSRTGVDGDDDTDCRKMIQLALEEKKKLEEAQQQQQQQQREEEGGIGSAEGNNSTAAVPA